MKLNVSIRTINAKQKADQIDRRSEYKSIFTKL
jgi:hypothetical protein